MIAGRTDKMTINDDASAFADHVIEIVERIRPLLAGQGASVQGVVLADLLAIWVAGHAPEMHEELLQMHIKEVRNLISEIIFGEPDASADH